MNTLKHDAQKLYLSWVNDFLTIDYFCEYYGLTKKGANAYINIGRRINEAQASRKHHE